MGTVPYISHESQTIGDVVIAKLKLVANQRGHLLELLRNDDPHFAGFGQVYMTMTYPGIVKAWYRHHRQIDHFAVVAGLMKLVLFDSREDSETLGHISEIVMGDGHPKIVQIPTGVWHGFQVVSEREALALHLNTKPYSFENPDEDRLPFDSPTIPYCWNN